MICQHSFSISFDFDTKGCYRQTPERRKLMPRIADLAGFVPVLCQAGIMFFGWQEHNKAGERKLLLHPSPEVSDNLPCSLIRGIV